jgi:glycosyltransferase involved in cell wall biosynthesis
LGGTSGNGVIPDELRSLCKRVIEPLSEPTQPQRSETKSRFDSWIRFFSACLFPCGDIYRPFLQLVLQHANTQRTEKNNWPNLIVRKALAVWSRLLPIPPMTSFMFDTSWRRIEHAARKLIHIEQFDIVWIEHTLSWPFMERLYQQATKRNFVICSSHNVETLVSQRLEATMRPSPFRDYYASQTRLMQKMERRAWNRSDLIIQCSDPDAEITRKQFPNKKIVTVPNGVDTEYFQKNADSSPTEFPTILFTAGFGYHPNMEAVEWFLAKVFPKILAAVPNCKFLFAGSEATLFHQKLRMSLGEIDHAVEYISDPADIRPCFDRAWVYVVPLQYGGGTRLKILEAMSMQVPVVSTTLGAEGVPYANGKHLLLADSPEDFAQAVIRLVNDSSLRSKFSRQAAEFVRQNYDWHRIRQQTYDILEKHCG